MNTKKTDDEIFIMRKNKMKSERSYFSTPSSLESAIQNSNGAHLFRLSSMHHSAPAAPVSIANPPQEDGGAVMAAHPARCKFSAPEQHCAFFGARDINL